jgi:hypothetical protein
VSYDNHTFISAPSLGEYERLIVQMEAVSKVVDEVINSSTEHRNFGGQSVSNQPTTATEFGLSDLLAMRRREAESFLARGGLVICFVYPNVVQPGVVGVHQWSRYSWLPAPAGFRYEEHLLPGFGTSGARVVDGDHPFAPYVAEFGARLAYRAVLDEAAPNFSDYGRIFIRSAGGAAIGAHLLVDRGYVILLPPLARWDADRASLAQTLFDCMQRWHERFAANSPD